MNYNVEERVKKLDETAEAHRDLAWVVAEALEDARSSGEATNEYVRVCQHVVKEHRKKAARYREDARILSLMQNTREKHNDTPS